MKLHRKRPGVIPAKTSHGTVTHADGRVQQLVRRTPAGTVVPVTQVGLTWQDFVVPGPRVTGAKSLDSDHPSHKHRTHVPAGVLTAHGDVPAPFPGQARRRDRRAAARHSAKHYEVYGAIGGEQDGETQESGCSCGAFFTAPTVELLREVTDQHYRTAS